MASKTQINDILRKAEGCFSNVNPGESEDLMSHIENLTTFQMSPHRVNNPLSHKLHPCCNTASILLHLSKSV